MTRPARKVTVIKAKKEIPSTTGKSHIAKRKVAAYARVSTDSDEQLNSYEAQISHYSEFIKSRSDWIFVDVYTDEGISGKPLAYFGQTRKNCWQIAASLKTG